MPHTSSSRYENYQDSLVRSYRISLGERGVEKEIYMPSENVTEKIRGFVRHGFEFEKTVGDQACGTCPFTGKEKHFFINIKNLLWDSKTSGKKGNFFQFLEFIHQRNTEEITQ